MTYEEEILKVREANLYRIPESSITDFDREYIEKLQKLSTEEELNALRVHRLSTMGITLKPPCASSIIEFIDRP